MKIGLLYKNGKIKFKSQTQITSELLRKTILLLVPNKDFPNTFIPIKPSEFWLGENFKIRIDIQIYLVNIDEMTGEVVDELLYTFDSSNLLEFVNSIYNVYKFGAISSICEDSYSYSSDPSYQIIYPRFIRIESNCGEYESDTKPITDIKESDFLMHSYTSLIDDKLSAFHKILFNPDTDISKIGYTLELGKHNWTSVQRIRDSTIDYFVYLPTTNTYHYIRGDVYHEINRLDTMTCVIYTAIVESDNHLSIQQIYRDVIDENIFSIENVAIELRGVNTWISIITILKSMAEWIDHIMRYTLLKANASRLVTFVVLECNRKRTLLNIEELTADKITAAFN